MAFMFESLLVYQKAVDFADRIASHTESFPLGHYLLVDQLNRAALSVATNLAEGNGRFTKADRRSFFTIARGSVQECVPLLEVSARRGFISADEHQQLEGWLEEMSKMLSGLITVDRHFNSLGSGRTSARPPTPGRYQKCRARFRPLH